MEDKAATLELLGEIDSTGKVTASSENIGSFKSKIMSLSVANVQWREWIQKRRDSVQPWHDFFKTSNFKLPKSITPIGKRVVSNIDRFQSNYMFVFLALVVFCIITSPLLLLAIAGCLGACYFISARNAERKISLMGRELSVAQQYAGVGLISFPLFWIAGAGSVFFWVIGASFFVIMLHASMYSLPDEQQPFELEMESVQVA